MACIAACMVVGPTKTKPRLLSSFASAVDSGVLAIDNCLWHDKVADPAQRDPDTIAIRGTLTALQEDDRWLVALLPVGDGLLTAVRR